MSRTSEEIEVLSPLSIRVKICGITNKEDAFLAADLGAFALGFVFFRRSKRFIAPDGARRIIEGLPSSIVKVGVFVEETPDEVMELKRHCGLDCVQIYDAHRWAAAGYPVDGSIIAARRVASRDDVERARKIPYLPLFDTGVTGSWGGTGACFDWRFLEGFDRPYILAGGIKADNVEDAVRLGPWAIDIASSVESRPGKKDPKKMRALFKRLEARIS
ncbi:MAG: phosphoribosylanthranilate isomerase [Syntrophorhabdaceae bacterium]|nr:phosphoribosylanthranilate isomerase [Syntrophorhabdaceae bacterium]